ncbi:hypothetical protein BST92_00605 [Nonlabens arenilitoris]|uniref:Peptidase M43 pregnancy-associated plasma-A domain-containing protein n=1 Tax=Nonlabens arenilitoris TaxID=1217969 RepID=A0A2S7U698_9FLAO|nr:choice-of-anchor D domain-containing protein [Nonlabens arenilitoris]PQJ30529.1 hypothetical protein BST92_00605 [Nonlabens arenilitoris]
MKKSYLLKFLFFILLLNGCTKENDDEVEILNTDISVATSAEFIIWLNSNDLNQKLNESLSYNLGNAIENQVNKVFFFNNDSTRVDVSIQLKPEFLNVLNDPNLANNELSIQLEKEISSELFDDSDNEISAANLSTLNQSILNGLSSFDINSVGFMEVPITLHIARDNNGNGGLDLSQLTNKIQELNTKFFGAKIIFSLCNSNIDYIDDNNFYNHTKNNEQYADSRDVANTLNIYVNRKIKTFDSQGNEKFIGGYAFFPFEGNDRIYVTRAGFYSSTLEHEIGHFFSLFHTHQSGNIASVGVNGSGCLFTGDAICDTPFDPNLNDLVNFPDCLSPNGTTLPDNIMSYAAHGCRTDFTTEQLIRMAFSARSQKNLNTCNGSSNTSQIQITGDLNFPDTQNGSQSAPRTFTVENLGDASFSIQSLIDTNEFRITNGASGITVPAMGSRTFNVVFAPSAVASFQAFIEVNNDADNANSNNSRIQAIGNGVANQSNQSAISINNSSLSFGNQTVGSTSNSQSIIVSNTGGSSFNISNISVPNGFSISPSSSTTINAGQSKTYQVTFSPSATQNYSGNIVFTNNADNATTVNSRVQVSGIGTTNQSNQSAISINNNSLSFGNVDVGTNSNVQSVTVLNTGNSSFNINSISVPNGFSISPNSSTNLGGGQSRTYDITFSPTSVQSYSGFIEFNNDADNMNATNSRIQVSGNGINNQNNIPNLRISGFRVTGDDNSDGIINAGEDIDFDLEVENFGNATATNVDVVWNTNNPDINIIDADRSVPDINSGSFEWNSGALDFDVDPNASSQTVNCTVTITSNEGTWNDTFTFDIVGSGGGALPLVDVGNNTPRDSCSATGSSSVYNLDLNTQYAKANWNLNNIISYGSDGNRGMWYQFDTNSNTTYRITVITFAGATTNGNAGFQIFSSCSGSPIYTINNASNGVEDVNLNLNPNDTYYIRFYDIDDNNPITFSVSIQD